MHHRSCARTAAFRVDWVVGLDSFRFWSGRGYKLRQERTQAALSTSEWGCGSEADRV